jgi:hypothetical protein
MTSRTPPILHRVMRRKQVAMGVAAGWLLLCLVGELMTGAPEFAVADGPGARVAILSASLPQPLSCCARHTWFAVKQAGEPDWERWDLWQEADAGVASLGHIHRNLQGPRESVGGGPTEVVAVFHGGEAGAFIDCLRREAPRYADRDTYRAWPGPNSNTFVDAMLRVCDLALDLPGTAVGKDWRGVVGASITARGTGAQVESPLVGAKLGLTEGVELHVLTITLGIDWWPPAIKHPFGDGRLGFADR